MEKVVDSYRKAVRTAVFVALAIWFVATPLLPQNPTKGKRNKSALGPIGGGPVLTFTPGIASTVAGTGVGGYSGDGGLAISAQFNSPMGMARDSQGNSYVADLGNSVARKRLFLFHGQTPCRSHAPVSNSPRISHAMKPGPKWPFSIARAQEDSM